VGQSLSHPNLERIRGNKDFAKINYSCLGNYSQVARMLLGRLRYKGRESWFEAKKLARPHLHKQLGTVAYACYPKLCGKLR
jgi:hypothetical protein